MHVGLLCGPAAPEELPKAEENNYSQRFEEKEEERNQLSNFGFYCIRPVRGGGGEITPLNNNKKPHFNL